MPAPLRDESGQIIVFIMLIVLVGLTVGLSIASRTLTTIRNSGDLSQSSRAFSAAEAGIESALEQIKNNAATVCTAPTNACTPTASALNVDAIQVTTNSSALPAYGQTVSKDDVLQVMLNTSGALASTDTLRIYWNRQAETDATIGNNGAVVVTVLYTNGTTYSLYKQAADPFYSGRAGGNNGFASPVAAGGQSVVLQDGTTISDFKDYIDVSLASGQPVLARIRLMYKGPLMVAVRARNSTGFKDLPSQGTFITSTATVDGKQRTVKAFQSFAQLPAIFDYALFNGSSNALTK
jgi:Tfp pilus assembly protein PilX